MGMQSISPQAVASRLLAAAHDAEAASGLLHDHVTGVMGIDMDSVMEATSIGFAKAVMGMTLLERRDKRFDFGVVRQAMLELMPAMLLSEVTSHQLHLMALQLEALAATVLERVRPKPKPLDPTPPFDDGDDGETLLPRGMP